MTRNGSGAVGVDTHRDTLTAAAVTAVGGVLGQLVVAADAAGWISLAWNWSTWPNGSGAPCCPSARGAQLPVAQARPARHRGGAHRGPTAQQAQGANQTTGRRRRRLSATPDQPCGLMAHQDAPAVARPPVRLDGGHRWRSLLAVLLGCLLAAACTSPNGGRRATATSQQPSAAPTRRDYWPTTGWRTAPPKAEGMDPSILATIPGNVSSLYPQVRSVLVVRHGYLVYEHYWHGFDAADGQELHSITKSIISALVGIALAEGHLQSLDQTIAQLLAAHLPNDADPRWGRVTVRQLLTMTSGLAGDEQSQGGDERLSRRLFQSRDWLREILRRHLAATPGTTFAYSNATSHLLSVIVATATGQSTLAFARARLYGPLGIHSDHVFEPLANHRPTPADIKAYQQAAVAWPRDPQGYQFGFGETKLPARDLAKLGYLYLNGGRWNTAQVVPADYVRASTQPHSNLPGLGPGAGYGYQWWTASVDRHPSFAAVGIGGQRLLVIPDLDLVVVITSDAKQRREDAQGLVGQSIIPAVTH
jgi:CubicO group peptidase (beta-lactamase class C family)